MASKLAPPMDAPSVPPSTMQSAGMLMIAATLEPSMVAPSAIERPPTTTPMRPETFMSARLPGRLGTGGRAGGAAHELEAAAALDPAPAGQRALEDARAPAAHGVHDRLRVLGHAHLEAGREAHGGVRGRLDRDDEVGVEVVVLVGVSEAVESNHGSTWGSRQGPLPPGDRTRRANL